MGRLGSALLALAVVTAGCGNAAADIEREPRQGAHVAFSGHQEGTRTFDAEPSRSGDATNGYVSVRFGAERGGSLMLSGAVENGELADDGYREVTLVLEGDGATAYYYTRPGIPCQVVFDRLTATSATGTFDCTLADDADAELTATGTFHLD
jgi:hypothetical protein